MSTSRWLKARQLGIIVDTARYFMEVRKMNGSTVAFSPREIEVLDLLAQWYVKDEEIAAFLGISRGNARNYVNRIMRLTGTHNRTTLVRYAQENGYGVKQSPRVTEGLSPSMVITQKLETVHTVAES